MPILFCLKRSKTSRLKKPSKQHKKTSSESSPQKSSVTSPQEIQNSPKTYPENILKEVDCRIDRAISIISIIATCIGIFVAAIAIILAIAVTIGFFEYRRWRQITKEANETLDNAKKDAKAVTELKENLEKSLDEQRKKIKPVSLTEKPSKELKEQINEFSKRLELVELFGIPLKYEDLMNRGDHFFYDGKFELSLKSFEKAIEIDPNYATAWFNAACVHSLKGEKEKSLKGLQKAIELDESCKKQARVDDDFKSLWDDDDFKKLTG